jgi:Zn-dependent protease with chaperone function
MSGGDIDLDLGRYIERRRGAAEQRARDGAAYAYTGEYRVRRTLQAARPVTLAIEATVRLWKNMAKAELLGTCVKVTDQQFPRLYEVTARSAARLGIPVPAVYVAPDIGELNAHTLGTDEDAYIVVNAALVDHLSDDELMFVIGHECGHIHNNHVVYSTALYYLSVAASFYVRWIVQPAILALQAWSRRAEITCDRAGLLCVRDPAVAESAMVKLALGSHKLYQDLKVDEYLKQLGESRRGIGRISEYFRSHPYLPKRIEASRLFAQSAYFRRAVGVSAASDGPSPLDAAELDEKVGALLSVW